MAKSVLVAVTRLTTVPKYNLRVRRTKKFMAHDEGNACAVGDTVRIDACRPLSKRKAWSVGRILAREKSLEGGGGGGGGGVVASAAAAAAATPLARGFAASAVRG